MTTEHQCSSHYKENDRMPEGRDTYLSEFLMLTRTAQAHPLTKHLPMRSIVYNVYATQFFRQLVKPYYTPRFK